MTITSRSRCIRYFIAAGLAIALGAFSDPSPAQPLSGAIFTTNADGSVVNGHSIKESTVVRLRMKRPPPFDELTKPQSRMIILRPLGSNGLPLPCGCSESIELSVPLSGMLKLTFLTDPYTDPDTLAGIDPGEYPETAELFVEINDKDLQKLGTVDVEKFGHIGYELRFSLSDNDTGEPPALLGGSKVIFDRASGKTRAGSAGFDHAILLDQDKPGRI